MQPSVQLALSRCPANPVVPDVRIFQRKGLAKFLYGSVLSVAFGINIRKMSALCRFPNTFV